MPVSDTAHVVVQVLYEGYPRLEVAFALRPGSVSDSHKLAAWGCSARQAVPRPMPRCCEMVSHETPDARDATRTTQ
jgi:hypothetical protein